MPYNKSIRNHIFKTNFKDNIRRIAFTAKTVSVFVGQTGQRLLSYKYKCGSVVHTQSDSIFFSFA